MRPDRLVKVRAAARGFIAVGAMMVAACAEPDPLAPRPGRDDAAAAGEAVSDARAGADAQREDASLSALDAGRATRGMSDAARDTPRDASGVDGSASDGSNALPELPQALRAAAVQALFPARDSQDLCPDPALRITFSQPPTLGGSGKLQVFDAAQPGQAVATIDMAKAISTVASAGVSLTVPRPAYLDGNAAVFYLPTAALAYGHEYVVRLEAAVLTGPNNVALSIDDDLTWRFRTKPAGPSDLSRLSVALDGSGDLCSLQRALDVVAGSARITIGRGTYHGIVRARAKHDLTLYGEDRKATILTGTNNELLNAGTSKRALISIEDSSGIAIENLTIHNRTAQGGSQAEALRLERCDKCSVRDADILSLQDTLLWSGRLYARNVLVAGNVDFIWGTGSAYFERCEIKTLGRKGYTVQARNAETSYGYVFVDSKLSSDPGISGHFLGRVDVSVYPASHVAYIDCELGEHIDPAGFLVTGGAATSLRFWEYQSKSPSGAPIDVSKRAAGVKQLSSQEAAQMRDPKVVLGGWAP